MVTFTEEIENFIFCAVQYLELCRVISRDLRKEKGKGQEKSKVRQILQQQQQHIKKYNNI